MKKRLLLLPFIAALIYTFTTGYSEGPGAWGSVNGTGSTGTTGCNCHSGSASAGTIVQVQLYDATGTTLITGGYTPGTNYQIKLTGSQSNLALTHFGFQLAVVKVAGAGTGAAVDAGTMSGAPSGTHILTVSGISIFEHYNGGSPAAVPGVLSGSVYNYSEAITWTAPVAGTGSVRIYGTINAVNHNGGAGAPDSWNNATLTVTEAVAVQPITGTLTVCAGSTTQLSDATPGGTWSSANTGVATVDVSGGLVSGVSAGTAVISYATAAGQALATVTVVPLPDAGSLSGAGSVCAGATISVSPTTSGGVWSSSNTTMATVNASGVVTGVSAGSVNISYTVTNSCGTDVAMHAVTVNPAPDAGVIVSGSSSICVGTTTAFSNTAGGGVWSSSNTAVATVDAGGVLSGVTAGSITLSYSVTNGCGTDVATTTVNVTTVASAGTITGATTVCNGGTAALSNGVAGGVWSSLNTGVATIDASGVVSGVSLGSAGIQYVVTSSCGTATATATVTVVGPAVAGTISGKDSVCQSVSLQLSSSVGGGVWSATNTLAVVSGTGLVTTASLASGLDTIRYTVTNVCGSVHAEKVVTVYICEGAVGGVGITQALNIYPNPARGSVTIELPAIHEAAILSFTDVTGRTLLTKMYNPGDKTATIDVHAIPAGNYVVRLGMGNTVFRQMVTIQ